MTDRTIDNAGIGAVYATFRTELTASNVNDAVTLVGNNEVGNVAGALLGRLAHVDGSGLCTVQIRGIMRLRTNGGLGIPLPRAGMSVVVVCGCVYHPMDSVGKRGIVLAVYEDSMTCDVLL